MKIYIVDLATFNTENICGRWFDLSSFTDVSELENAVNSFVVEQNNWEIHEYELDYAPFPHFGKKPELQNIFQYYKLVLKYGQAFAVWYNLHNNSNISLDNWENVFLRAYYGKIESYKELAKKLVSLGIFGKIPEPSS